MERGRPKKIINSVNSVVRDNLIGYVSIHTGLRLLEKYNVVFRHDLEKVSGKVALLSGGGSGHEPFPAGFIGKGMLTAGVAGEIFTSPAPAAILAALRLLGKSNSAGVLIISMNYTGDRLNFALAMERAKLSGTKVRMVVVAEDCALSSKDKTAGRRGLSGGTFIHKIAGAMAEEGKSLDEIYHSIRKILKMIGTISVSLTPCNIPGSGSSFVLPEDLIELGLGIHGEPGVKRMKHVEASALVKVMVDAMKDESSASHLALYKGDRIALIINNLGGTSNLEMNIAAKEAIQYFESLGILVERAYCACLMTSLEMAGISLSVLKLGSSLLPYLDAPTLAPAWPLPYFDKCKRETPAIFSMVEEEDSVVEDAALLGPKLLPEEQKLLEQCLHSVCSELISSESLLNALDREGGDGDCGLTIKRGAQAIQDFLLQQPSLEYPRRVSSILSSVVEDAMGGSSGALYSLFLSRAADTFQEDCSFRTWCQAVFRGMQFIQELGGAEPGDRTMVDSLNAFCSAIEEPSKTCKTFEDQVSSFCCAAEEVKQTAKDTAKLKAKAGRASYVDEERLTSPDPGAEAVAIWIGALAKTLVKNL